MTEINDKRRASLYYQVKTDLARQTFRGREPEIFIPRVMLSRSRMNRKLVRKASRGSQYSKRIWGRVAKLVQEYHESKYRK